MGAEVGRGGGVCHEKRCVCFAGLFGWWKVEGSNVMGLVWCVGVVLLFFFVGETDPC